MAVEWGVIDEESIAEARALIGVPLRRDRMQWVEAATADAIRQFCLGVGDDNPLWHDPVYAASSMWKALLAPPSFLYAVDATIVAPKLPGVQWIYAGTRWRWFDVIRVDDVFETSAELTRMDEKSGRRFGLWVLQTGQVTYRRRDGSVAAIAEGRVARTPRTRTPKGEGGGAEAADTPGTDSPDLLPTRRAGTTRLWESVTSGEVIGPVVRALRLDDIYRWYVGAQGALHYGGAHGDAVRYRHRHDDFEINERTGAKDFAARGHFSSKQGQQAGMGGAYDVGPHRISWLIAMLTDWLGDDGFLAELDVDVLLPNLVGDTTELSGEVTELWKIGNAGNSMIRIEVSGRNQHGQVSTRGSAVAALPSRENGPVSLPLTDELNAAER